MGKLYCNTILDIFIKSPIEFGGIILRKTKYFNLKHMLNSLMELNETSKCLGLVRLVSVFFLFEQ